MNSKIISILIISAIFLAIAVFVVAQTNEELEAEKALLEQELADAGYNWLIDYPADENLDVASIEVYEQDGNETIAVIENISSEGWYKTYLTGLGECYDNETEILTDEGWKLFNDLDETEEVATLNQRTRELEWQKPTAWQVFDNDGEMFKIETNDGDLLVSEKHRVYSASKYGFNLEVLNTLVELMTGDSWKWGSLDQTGMLSSNASARKGMSDLCEINLEAFDKEFLNGSLRNIILRTDSLASLNDSGGMFDLEQISSEYLSSSFVNQSGLNNLMLYFSTNCLVNESFLNNENTIFVSQTSSIYNLPSFFNLLYKSSLTCSPNLRQSSSVNLLFLNNSFNFCNASCFLTVSRNDSLATSDQFIQTNLFNSDFVFSGRVNVTDGIYNAPRFFSSSNFCNSASLLSIANFNTSFQLISGNFFLASSNSLGRDNVIVGILVSPNNLVYIVKSVDIYKSFDLDEFSLQPITEVYEDFNNGGEIYFLDAENNPVEVKSIVKEKYDGKIYDVDVENDIVLVRRKAESQKLPAHSSQIDNEVSPRDDTGVPNDKTQGCDNDEQLGTMLNDCLSVNNIASQNDLLINSLDKEKNKMGSNGMEPNKLTPDCNDWNESKYLNVSVDVVNSRAGMAEWSTQSANTRYPSGCVGLIPTLGAIENSELQSKAKYIEINGKLIDVTGAVWSGNSNLQDVFDLRVLGSAGVEFDYIVDPAGTYNISFVSPTPANDTTTANTSIEINVSITNAHDLNEVKFNWNWTNFTFFSNALKLMFNFDNVSSLGENETYVADVSGNSNQGTVIGGAVMNLTGGRYGGAFEFDGDDDYINVTDTEDFNLNELGIEFWFKPDKDYDSGTSYVSLVYYADYEISIQNGKMVFSYKDNNLSSTSVAWDSGQWYHVLATYNGTTQALYINGLSENDTLAFYTTHFTIQNSSSDNIVSFYDSGNIVLSGSCTSGGCSYPGDGSFIIQNSTSDTVAYINSSGNLCLTDSDCNDNDINCDSPSDGSFIVKTSNDRNVAYIDSSGELCMIGVLTENGNP